MYGLSIKQIFKLSNQKNLLDLLNNNDLCYPHYKLRTDTPAIATDAENIMHPYSWSDGVHFLFDRPKDADKYCFSGAQFSLLELIQAKAEGWVIE